MTVLDLGANAGYYTLLLSRLVGAQGRVSAFEPLPSNVVNILDHLAWNRITNCSVFPAAVSSSSGLAGFHVSTSNSMGYLGDRNELLQVPTVTLDELVEQDRIGVPDLVKMDVEGAESDVLAGAARLLALHRTIWFIALHGETAKSKCQKILSAAGYRIFALDGSYLASSLDEWPGDEIYVLP